MAGDRSIKEIISPSMRLTAFLRAARADLRCVAVSLICQSRFGGREKEGECHCEAPGHQFLLVPGRDLCQHPARVLCRDAEIKPRAANLTARNQESMDVEGNGYSNVTTNECIHECVQNKMTDLFSLSTCVADRSSSELLSSFSLVEDR